MSVVPGPPHGLQVIEAARRDPDLVVLEGFHAVKHALRFGAEVTDVFAADIGRVTGLAEELAPDLVATFASRAVAATEEELRRVAPHTPTAVVGVARRPRLDLEPLVATRGCSPLVLLEDPRNLGNVGAAVRVAAAADVGGVLTTGRADPWDSAALRGSAGLHFALPVGRIESLCTERPVLGLDPEGEPLRPSELPDGAVLAFGSERAGLSEALRVRCAQRLALPMRDGVSSLNLATAVAAVLFTWRLGGDRPGG